MKLRPEEALVRRQERLARRRQEEMLARHQILPVRCLADERDGRPAVKIFVQDDEVQCLRLNRIVQKHAAGYAAYRPGKDTPFLIAQDINDALGLVTKTEIVVKALWKDENP